MKKYLVMFIALIALAASGLAATGCSNKADVASKNLSQAADNFEVNRKIKLINGITDNTLLEIDGLCSINDDGNQLEVTCRQEDGTIVKDFLHLSDNITYVVEQAIGVDVSDAQYRVTFAPKTLIPDVHTP